MGTHNTILITGANRGVGRAIAEIYLSRSNHNIIGLVRDPFHETSKSLFAQTTGTNSSVILIPYDASITDSAKNAMARLSSQYPHITHIDTVIANAGFLAYSGPSLSATPETYISHYTVNTLGPLLLFQACLPLLTSQTFETGLNTNLDTPIATIPAEPKFIALSSGTGSTTLLAAQTHRTDTTGIPRSGGLPYTASKCALNHIMCKLSLEYPEVNFGLFTPGPTKTEFGGDRVNFDVIPGTMDVDGVARGLVAQFDTLGVSSSEADGEETGEQQQQGFVLRDWKGMEIAW